MTGQNLLPRHRIEAWRLRRCVSAWMVGLGVLAMLVGGLVLGAIMTQAQPHAMPVGLVEQIDLARSDLALTRAHIEALKQTRSAHERASATPQWHGLLAVLARESGGRARLRAIQVEPIVGASPSWSVSVVGVASAREVPVELAARLEATGLFASVRHGMMPKQPGRDDIDFHLDCVITPGSKP